MTGDVFRVRVRLFGQHREAAGVPAVEMELAVGSTASDVLRVLRDHPAVNAPLSGAAVAVNHEYSPADRVIRRGDEVAIIPPVAGG